MILQNAVSFTPLRLAIALVVGALFAALAGVLVGENPASQVYVRNKIRACEELGFYSENHVLPEDTTEEALLALIGKLNRKESIHGILVQLPLPKQIREEAVIAAISPE